MGKDLRGKKLPDGISQRKDGRYSARFTSKTGKRVEKYFSKVNEAKKWLAYAPTYICNKMYKSWNETKDTSGDTRACKYWRYYESVCTQYRG